jgi:hypothetical protein
MVALTGAGTAAGRTIVSGTAGTQGKSGITITNGDGIAGNPTIAASVYSVQGQYGDVIVSVPVQSVQSQTGPVVVTNIPGNAATATNVAWSGVQSPPTQLGQFSNNLGNYGNFKPNCQTNLSQFSNDLGNYGNFNPNCRCNC